ncbi:hypothetical protein V9L05_06185 [Bernardetia sp. Wsw4-3y2]|uniref:PBECR3 domain-containing polyvalent protein n=1 Tax=unclassified Bernardetia TaxID=2647129 RepID=UPI0030D48F7B
MNIKESIERLFDEVTENKNNELKIIDLGKIEKEFHQKIIQDTKEDLNNFLISIDSYSIRHSLNRHGKDNELNNSQLPIEKSDFTKIIEVVFEADLISADEKKGKKSVLFHKKTETTLIAIFEIRRITSKKKSKVSRIMLQTLYKKKPSTK